MAKRGPSYPAINLEDAVELAKQVFAREHTSPLNRESAVLAMGYKGLSGASTRKLAAVRAYGLLEGRDDEIRISGDAITIIADENADDQANRIKALKRCLESPPVFSDLIGRYESASPDNVASYLIKNGFKPQSAQVAASAFAESVSFLKRESERYNQEHDREDEDETGPSVGDYIQWESQGILQFSEPKRVSKILDNGYLYVEGSQTAIPIAQTEVVDPPEGRSHGFGDTPYSPPPGTNMKQDTFTLSEGQVVIQWPAEMSSESFEDFTDWLCLQHRKIGRSAEGEKKPSLSVKRSEIGGGQNQ